MDLVLEVGGSFRDADQSFAFEVGGVGIDQQGRLCELMINPSSGANQGDGQDEIVDHGGENNESVGQCQAGGADQKTEVEPDKGKGDQGHAQAELAQVKYWNLGVAVSDIWAHNREQDREPEVKPEACWVDRHDQTAEKSQKDQHIQPELVV